MNPQKTKLFINKKASTTGQTWAMILVVLSVISGILFYGFTTLSAIPQTQQSTSSSAGTPSTPSAPSSFVSCDSDKRADYKDRYRDVLQQSNTYVADITSYAVPTDSRAVRVTGTNTTATGSFASIADVLICDEENPISYTPVSRTYRVGETSTNELGYISDSKPTVVAQGAEVDVDFIGKGQDRLQMIVIDNKVGITSSELNNTLTVGLGFSSISGTTNYTTQNAQGVTVGAGQELDLTFRIKTNTSNAVFGEDDFGFDTSKVFKERTIDDEKLLPVIVAVDTTTATDWAGSGPVISRNGGTMLELAKGDLLVEDAQALSNFDFFFATEQFTDRESTVNFILDAADSATNPSSSPLIRFCSLAKYNSADLTDTLRVSCYDDSSSRALVAFATDNTVQISTV